MTDTPANVWDPSRGEGTGLLRAARRVAFVAALLLVWVSLEPFVDLRAADAQVGATGQLALTYIAFATMAAACLALAAPANMPALVSLSTAPHWALLAWMAVNIAISSNPALSLQRFVLTASVMAVAILVPLLPDSRKEFDRCLATAALALLVLCYAGLLLAPGHATHTAADVFEPDLAGDWRGTFAHKNVAAPVMAVLVYVGLYLARSGLAIPGLSIVLLAGGFLLGTGGKSATALCLATGLLVVAVARTRSFWLKAIICLLPMVVMNLLSVGSAVNDALLSIVKLLPIDSSFTGRADIWKYAFSAFMQHPLTGYGYTAFWDTVNLSATDEAGWVTTAPHSHNSYLDLALTIGLPGLLLVMAVFAILPLRNFQIVQQNAKDDPLALLFVAIWLFGINFGVMETFLLNRQDPTWFVFVVAVAGLHYLARFRTNDGSLTATDLSDTVRR